jgi:hypothetical protein
VSEKPIGARAQRPNPALEPLAFLIGEWATVGTHPVVPGEHLRGSTSFAWAEGGAFLIMRSHINHKNFPNGIAIFGSDNALGTMTMCWFDERGISRICPAKVTENSVSWHHDDPKFPQRVTIVAEADGRRMRSNGEMAEDGKEWGDDLSQVFVRIG